jgi:hypothetical protein
MNDTSQSCAKVNRAELGADRSDLDINASWIRCHSRNISPTRGWKYLMQMFEMVLEPEGLESDEGRVVGT